MQQKDFKATITALLIAVGFYYRVLKSSIYQASALSLTQYCVLLELQEAAANSHSLTIGEIARKLSLTSSAISTAVRGLENAGFVVCSANRDDRRCIDITLCAQGNTEVKRMDTAVVEALSFLWELLLPSQRRKILESTLKAMSAQKRLRVETGHLRAETAFAECLVISFNAFTEAARLHRISLNESIILAWLCEQQQPRSLSEASTAVLQKLNYVVQVSNKLASRMLIERETATLDRRKIMLMATDAGRERMQRIQRDMDRAFLNVFSECTLEELECLMNSSDVVIAAETRRNRFE